VIKIMSNYGNLFQINSNGRFGLNELAAAARIAGGSIRVIRVISGLE
jgi:hypothetical protein